MQKLMKARKSLSNLDSIENLISLFAENNKKKLSEIRVSEKAGLTPQEREEKRLVRVRLWDGFVRFSDFTSVLSEFEFKFLEPADLTAFLESIRCYSKKYGYVNCIKVIYAVYVKQSKFNTLSQRFENVCDKSMQRLLQNKLSSLATANEQSNEALA